MKWFSTKEVSVLMDSMFFFQSIVKVCPLENSLDMMLLEVHKKHFFCSLILIVMSLAKDLFLLPKQS